MDFMTTLKNQSWLNLALIRHHRSPVIIPSFHSDPTHWNAHEGLARFSCNFRRILRHISCHRGNCFAPQMVFADRAVIPFYNPEFIRDHQAMLHSWQLLAEKPQTKFRGVSPLELTLPGVLPGATRHWLLQIGCAGHL